jgi:hypothetical protein
MTDPITRDPAHAPQGTYDGRPAQRTLRSPEQPGEADHKPGGRQLTGPVGIGLEPEGRQR